MIGLFCRISSLLKCSFAKETCNFKEPTNRSHPIVRILVKVGRHSWVDYFLGCKKQKISYQLVLVLSKVFLYGVATISRLLKIIGFVGEYRSLLWGSFAKETYNFKEPINRSHPIPFIEYQRPPKKSL